MVTVYVVSRFTPTYVGTSSRQPTEARFLEVHPHVCGDFKNVRIVVCFRLGSPPRMWGLLCELYEIIRKRRFTPTYVGTSAPNLRLPCGYAVHPHVCGDFTR